MKKILILPLLIFLSVAAGAQKLNPSQESRLDQLYKNSSVVYFTFPVMSMQEVSPLAKIIHVDNFKAGKVYAHATKDQFRQFIVKNYVYTVAPEKKPAAKPAAKPVAKPAAKPAAKKTKPKAKPGTAKPKAPVKK